MGFVKMSPFANVILIICVLSLQSAEAFWGDGGCPIVTRKEWKGRSALAERHLVYFPAPFVVIHHGGAGSRCYDQDTCAAIVRSYQNHHMDDNKWDDIGYNFVIGEDGNVYVGRGWNLIGAHAPALNNQSIGICIIGDFSNTKPNYKALDALNNLISCGVKFGKIRSDYQVVGHRQVRETDCPGDSFYSYVKNMPRWTSDPKPLG